MFYTTVSLFTLNLIDAVLTIFWIRKGATSEANFLMAFLLEKSDILFFLVKLSVGILAMAVFLKWKELRIARYGAITVLVIYSFVLLLHFMVGALFIMKD
ncbi:MAG: DUF5658 family protein [Pyrinomonadaceae bacterium]|nr:DUF5658 family protein [Pyrinomonadaceae bacterium]MCX7640870.1 DUF5658 family protein [Pyrinomonadaceae bacterium]MDW8304286.1 DUF5658 family protein [Acidobacteriota bacterium]